MLSLTSIQIGHLRTEGDPASKEFSRRRWTTGFYKLPVEGAVTVGNEGLIGNAVADTVHHGGPLSYGHRASEPIPDIGRRGDRPQRIPRTT